MEKNLKDYKKIVGEEVIDQIHQKAKKLSKKHIVCISSTHQAGGVAEILNSIVFLFNEVGIKFGWRILHGTPDFFTITKKIHNALQGADIHLTSKKKKIYYETNERFSAFSHLDHDLIVVHDPQPLPLVGFYQKENQPWVFRFHLDLSKPNRKVWNYLKQFLKRYDEIVVSAEEYKKNISTSQTVIHPAIDPLSPKNRPLPEKVINKYLAKNGIDTKRPIIAQVSRYDKWKNPEGVIRIFDKIKKQVDCQLVLLGNMAPDDPENIKVYSKIIRKFGDRKDIRILVNIDANDLVVNALQTKSQVIIQNSLREGFGLTVSEALYKGTPVVASNVGGIPLQVINGETGFLHQPSDVNGFAQSIIKLLKDKDLREEIGNKGREYVKNNFLITRLILDWLDLFEKYLC